MPAPVYLGDETSAAGYALAGVDARVPAPGGETAALALARATAPLVLVAADVASRIDAREWRAAVQALAPLVIAVPDLAGAAPIRDVAADIRRDLGLEEAS
jgi:vacuolar-type H+-ATPase subunit F/Vma7